MLLHVLLCLLCILISIQLQHNVYDTATRHSATTCNFRSNRPVVNARAFNKHSIRDNSASCMLHLSNDCDTVVNWYKYQAAKPAAVHTGPISKRSTKVYACTPCIAPHLRQNSCSTTGCTHNDENPRPARRQRRGPDHQIRDRYTFGQYADQHHTGNRYNNYYCSIESAQVPLSTLATSAACIWHMRDKVRSTDSSG